MQRGSLIVFAIVLLFGATDLSKIAHARRVRCLYRTSAPPTGGVLQFFCAKRWSAQYLLCCYTNTLLRGHCEQLSRRRSMHHNTRKTRSTCFTTVA